MLGEMPDEAQLQRSAANAVRTFLRAYRPQAEPLTAAVHDEIARRRLTTRTAACLDIGLRRPAASLQ